MDEDEGVVLMHACHGYGIVHILRFFLVDVDDLEFFNTLLVLVFIMIHGVQRTYFALYRLDGHRLIDCGFMVYHIL